MTIGPGSRPGGGLFRVAVREMGRVAGSPLLIALMVVLPVVCTAWLRGIFDVPVPRDLPVAWIDHDDSPLSRTLIRLIDATPSVALTAKAASMAEAERLVRAGEVYGVVVVPSGFARDVVRGDAPAVSGFYNAQLLLAAGLVARDLQAAVLTVSAGVEITAGRRRGIARVALEPMAEPIRVRPHLLHNPQLNYDHYLVATLLPALFQMIAMMGVVMALGLEFKDGVVADWIAAAGGRPWKALAGKLLVHTLWYGLLATALLAIVFDGLGMPLRGSAGVLVGAAWLFALACAGLGTLVLGACGSLRVAASVVAFYTGIAYPFMGVTFPTMAMPAGARAWADLIPLSPFITVLFGEGLRGGVPGNAASPMAALGLFAAVGLAAGAPLVWAIMTGRRAWSAS